MIEEESKAIRRIVKCGVTPVELEGEITLQIFCRPNQISALVMKNNNTPKPSKENETNIVYKFECNVGACKGPQHRLYWTHNGHLGEENGESLIQWRHSHSFQESA